MGFYGNITNTSRTQFQFDKRYPNRKTMDESALVDGIYIGRYVLVEYDTDSDMGVDRYMPVYRDADKRFYTSYNQEEQTLIKISDTFKSGTIVRVPIGWDDFGQAYNIENPLTDEEELWQCNNSGSQNVIGKVATFTLLSTSTDSNYVKNYAIDTEKYGKGRGYDSTVWQKVYLDGTEKYVMVAELNTVVPTFDISADAPTLSPITPHFDTDSTNVYYKLHWQPQWGFRIKCADGDLVGPELNSSGVTLGSVTDMSTDSKDYPSDETTNWERTGYNKISGVKTDYIFNYDSSSNTGNWLEKTPEVVASPAPAAIYYNKAGFDPDVITYSNDKEYSGWDKSEYHVFDTIELSPTGQSGARYPLHDGTTKESSQPDTQELSIILPSLGDSIAKVWDIVYGDRKVNEDYNTQLGNHIFNDNGDIITYGSARNKHLEWQNALSAEEKEGHRLIHKKGSNYTYSIDEVDTLAGAINSVHDLMGMIITGGLDENNNPTIDWDVSDSELQKMIDGFNKDYIYYKDGHYYRKHLTYDYTKIETDNKTPSFTPISLTDWDSLTEKPYYIDSNLTTKPNYILDNEFHPKMTYVNNLKLTSAGNIGGEYQAYKYYNLETNLLNGGTFNTYKINSDTTYYEDKTYYSIVEEQNVSYLPKYFYEPETFYYKDKDNDVYVLDASDKKQNYSYYLKQNGEYIPVTVLDISEYEAGVYYTYNNSGYSKDYSDSPKSKTTYYSKQCIYYPGIYYYAVYEIAQNPNDGIYLTEQQFKTGKYYKEETTASPPGDVFYYKPLGKDDTPKKEINYYKKDGVYTLYSDENDPGTNVQFYAKTTVVSGILINSEEEKYNSSEIYFTLKYIKDNNVNPVEPYYHYEVVGTPVTDGSDAQYIQINTFEKIDVTPDTYDVIELDSSSFKPDIYYIKKYKDEYALATAFDSKEIYYIKNEDNTYSEVADINKETFEQGTYYIKRKYFELADTFDAKETYYKKTIGTYSPGVYYIKNADGSYTLDEDEWDDREYYKKTITYQQIVNTDIIDITSAERVQLLNLNSNSYYYKELDKNSQNYNYIQVNSFNYYPLSDKSKIFYTLTPKVLTTVYSKNNYYYQYLVEDRPLGEDKNGSYLLSVGAFNKDKQYYADIQGEIVDTIFYEPYKYFYEDADGEYILATNPKYGYDNLNNKVDNIVYYTGQELYVYEDKLDIYKQGAKWNPNAPCPETVTLATRTERYELQELKELGYRLNTIHGLILKIHELLEDNDYLTRDQRTAQGTINLLNDMIAKFDKMVPAQFTIVDEYGRLHSSAHTSAEEFSTANIQEVHTEDNAQSSTEDRFIIVNIDPNAKDPKITFQHNYTQVDDTTTISDKNSGIQESNYGNNYKNDDVLDLYTPIVDNKGHIVGKNIETVTLPFGFKNLLLENYSGDDVQWSQSGGATSSANENVTRIVADNTQDTLRLKGGNKWIRLQSDAITGAETNKDTLPDGNNILTIAHETHNINTQAKQTNKNSDNVASSNDSDKITIQDLTFDIAGHVTANQPHTYTLPYGYKTIISGNSDAVTGITGNSESVIAKNTQDSISLISGNKWINIAGSQANKNLVFGHALSSLSTGLHSNSQSSLSPTFGASFNIPVLTTDEAGHLVDFTTETITLPKGNLINLNEKTLANVITDLSFVQATGELSVSRTNVGDLILTGYNKPDSITQTITEQDSVNTAFGKLKFELDKEITDRETAISDEAKTRQDADDNLADSFETALSNEIDNRNQAITEAIEDLDYTDTPTNGQYISEINETDGKITVNRKDILYAEVIADEDISPNTFINSVSVNEEGSLVFNTGGIQENTFAPYADDYVHTNTEFIYDETTNLTIEGLITKIIELENRIKVLEPEETPTDPDSGTEETPTDPDSGTEETPVEENPTT